MNSYGPLARRYDVLTRDVDYDAWAGYLRRHFQRADRNIQTVVDLACGTGSLTARLSQMGYHVLGVDRSVDMLALAADKCAGLSPAPLLLRQDMSRLRLPGPVDAVVCCLDSLNYVVHPSGVQKTFRHVWHYLKPGGLFLFDIRTPAMLRAMDQEICLDEAEDVYCVWRGSFSRRAKRLTYRMDLFYANPDGSWSREAETHQETAYEPEELERWLRAVGFSAVRRYGNLSMQRPRPTEDRIFFTARKDTKKTYE